MNEKGRQTKLLAAIAIIAMVVCAFAVIMPSEETSAVDVPTDAVEIDTAEELISAGTEGGTYVLTTDITLGNNQLVAVTAETFNLYLNGNDITSNYVQGTIFDIDPATGNTSTTPEVAIYGPGVLSNAKDTDPEKSYCLIDLSGGKLTLDGNVTINADEYGVYVMTGGVLVSNNATITAGASAISGNGTQENSSITINGGRYTSTGTSAVYMPSTQTLDINGGEFKGLTGIEIRAGTTNIDGATITATGSLSDVKEGGDGPVAYGMAVAIIDRAGYADSTQINVTIGSDVVLNGNSYDVYVGDMNGTSENKVEGVFNTATIGYQYNIVHSIKLTMPGYTHTFTGNVYRFAANDVSATSFTVPAGFVMNGNVSFTSGSTTNTVTLTSIKAGNGGITFTQGSTEISGIMTAADAQAKIEASSGDIVLKNLTILKSDGDNNTLEISGDVGVEGNVIVSEGVTVAIQDNSSLNVAENAVLSVSGSVTVTSTSSELNNEGTVAITNTKAEVPDVIGGNGNVDSSAVASDGTLSGSYDTTTTFTQNQIITVTDDTILVEGTQFVFEGRLIIPEGVTLTIEAGAQLVVDSSTGIIENNGTIIIESDASMTQAANNKYITAQGGFVALGTSKVINNGTIELVYYADVTSGEATNGQFNISSTANVENNGTINVGEESILKAEGNLVNTADATINMNGYFSGKIRTAGTVVINGTTPKNSAGAYITFTDAGATVQIDNLTGTIRIDDSGISNRNITVVTTGTENGNDSRLVNYVRISSGAIDKADSNMIVSGITVTSEITSEVDSEDKKVTYYYNNMVLSGSVSAEYVEAPVGDAPATAGIRTDGPRAIVSGELILDANITYEIRNKLTVSGTINVDEDATFTGSGTPTLEVTTGTVAIESNAIGTSTMNIIASYYKVAKTSTTPEMHYYTTLANALASGATPITVYGPLVIDQALTINDGITVNAQSTVQIKEEGSLTINDGGRFNAGTHTVTVDGSLYAAVEKTGLRGTSDIKSDVVSRGESDVLYTNLYVALNDAESGDTVTMSQSKTTDRDITVKEGVTLRTGANTLTLGNDTVATVNGTIYTNGGSLAVESEQAENEKAGSITLNGLIQSDMPMDYGGAYPAGAYYSITSAGKVLYYISTVEDAATIISTVDQSTISIYGDVTIGDIALTGTADERAVAIVYNDMVAGTITLDLAEIQIAQGATFDGAVTDGNGTVDINVSGSETAAIGSEMIDDAKAFVISGTFGNTVTEDTKYTFNATGNVDVDGASIPGLIVEGTVDVTGNSSITGDLVIDGTMNVDAGVTLTANTANTTIAGTLNAVMDDDGTKATVTLGNVYVGLELVDSKIANTTAGEVVGTITYTTMYVSADSSIPDTLIDNKASTGFYVEDALWLTAYGSTAIVTNAPVENADFQGWDNPETESVEKMDGSSISIANYERLDAVIDYNVYDIRIYVDNGIGTVAVDGNIATQGSNYFTVENLTAGTHTITYTLKSNYEGTPVLSSDSVTVNGLSFTLSGDFENDEGEPIVYVLNLTGTSPSNPVITVEGGNGGSDGLGLTDYLLIILVILIVVMAIIVALRLMRS